MLVRTRHLLIGCVITAVLVAGAMLLYLFLRQAGDVDAALEQADLVLAAVALATLGAAGVGGFVYWHVQSTTKVLATQLATVRHSPSRASLDATPLSNTQIAALGSLYDECAALSRSYRQAIVDRLKQREALTTLQTRLANAAANGGETSGTYAPNSHRPPGASRNMVARLTPNLRWINATPALLKLLGSSLADINGRAFTDVVHPTYLAELTDKFRDIQETGEGHNLVFKLCVRRERASTDGGPPRRVAESRYVQMDVLTRYDEAGRPQHFRCYFEDISEKVRAENKLRRRTEQLLQTNERLLSINQDLERLKESYRDLYHNAPIMYFSLDDRGHFVACNDTMVQALGYRREDLSDQPYSRLLPGKAAEAWERGLAPSGIGARATAGSAAAPTAHRPHALMADGEVEMQWVKRDGTVIDVWIRNIPLMDEQGRFLRSRSAAQDITQRKALSDELRHRGDELERANDELHTINRELDSFTSTVAHDLREPLRTLEAYSNLLAEDFSTQLGPDGFECINHMLMASRRLAKLIDDLLALSRAGRIAMTPRAFNLNEALAVVRRDLGDMIQRRNAVVLTEGSLPTVVGDMERVAQLLANLITNGLRYNTQPQPMVVIGAVEQSKAPGFATVFVRDNGIGIDPRYHQEIFGIFRRLHRNEEYEGTGAGLAICKRIVQVHGGQIWVESVPGRGAAFFVTLPRCAADAPTALMPAMPTLATAVPGPLRPAAGHDDSRTAGASAPGPESEQPARTLLLVEDNQDMGLIVRRLAEKAGHLLQWVTSAEAAWEHLQKHRPDLVLLDIHLSPAGMTGIELCRRLRALPEQAELPIALFSGEADPEDIPAGLAAGANFVLSKALLCHPDAWRRRLEEVLQGSH
jgi:signal transduction histidine kinase/CheY-like chemotaxis protein